MVVKSLLGAFGVLIAINVFYSSLNKDHTEIDNFIIDFSDFYSSD